MYLIFKNKTPIAIATTLEEAKELAREYEVSIGASHYVRYPIVKVSHGDYLENLHPSWTEEAPVATHQFN